MVKDNFIPFEFALTGKLITAKDPSVIGHNFRSLKNLRYTDTNPKGIGGMTPINSTAIANPKVRNMIHYRKDQPTETHLLIHAFDSNNQNGKIFHHTQSVPSTGAVESTPLFTCTDATTERPGIFSNTPGGVAFCDGKDSLIYSGEEMEVGAFINYNPSNTFKKDYTDIINNNLTDANNIATLTRVAAGSDSDTKMLLHFDNNVNDSSTVGHVITAPGVTFSAATKVFGSHAISITSTAPTPGYMAMPDHTGFDFSGGVFTIDFRFRTLSATRKSSLYYQRNTGSSHHIKAWCSTGGALKFKIKDCGSTILVLSTAAGILSADTWYHAAIVENSSNYYIFIDGDQKVHATSTGRPRNLNGAVCIGSGTSGGTSSLFLGFMDEYRVSKGVARWTSNFEPPGLAYGTGTQTYMYLGARRPVKGFKAYMGSVKNSSSGSMSVYEWTGSGWSSVSSLVDNTSCGNKYTFGKTGTVVFTSTVATSKPKAIDDRVLYWYKIILENATDAITVTQITNNAPMQQIKDLWDGEERTISACWKYITNYQDYISNVGTNNYDESSSATFMQLNSFDTTTGAAAKGVYVGSLERLMGISASIPAGYENTTANTALTVQYSSDGMTWTDVSGLNDGTAVGGISFNKSGIITWTSPNEIAEFERTISTDVKFYYYKLSWSQAFSASVRVYYIAGIPSPQTIRGYAAAMIAKNRLWLIGNEDGKYNFARCCAQGLTEVWNGNDSWGKPFGDEAKLVGGISLYSVLGANIYEIGLFFKQNRLYGLSGDIPDEFKQYEITIMDGLVAPRTLKTANALLGNEIRPVAIWQGAKGIYMFDNRSAIPIHGDIENFFDLRETTNTRKIHSSYIEKSNAFIDKEKMEYHWFFADASSTGALNREFVYDLKRGKWYEIDRGTGKRLQAGASITDSDGNKYFYGALNTGYLERLENGNHFDGNAIDHEMWLGDMAPYKESIMAVTAMRKIKLHAVSTTATANNITVKYYTDGATAASSSFTLSPQRLGHRIIRAKKSLTGENTGVFHSFRFNISTTNQPTGFTPLFIGGHYEVVREDE